MASERPPARRHARSEEDIEAPGRLPPASGRARPRCEADSNAAIVANGNGECVSSLFRLRERWAHTDGFGRKGSSPARELCERLRMRELVARGHGGNGRLAARPFGAGRSRAKGGRPRLECRPSGKSPFSPPRASGIIHPCARVAEWQTRRSQKPLSKDVRVRLSPRAPFRMKKGRHRSVPASPLFYAVCACNHAMACGRCCRRAPEARMRRASDRRQGRGWAKPASHKLRAMPTASWAHRRFCGRDRRRASSPSKNALA